MSKVIQFIKPIQVNNHFSQDQKVGYSVIEASECILNLKLTTDPEADKPCIFYEYRQEGVLVRHGIIRLEDTVEIVISPKTHEKTIHPNSGESHIKL